MEMLKNAHAYAAEQEAKAKYAERLLYEFSYRSSHQSDELR